MGTIAKTKSFCIIGAGPAGLIAGIELLKIGHQVIIIEKNEKITRPACGEYLTPEGVKTLQKIDLAHTISEFEKINGMHLISPFFQEVITDFPQYQFGVALNRTIWQSNLVNEFYKQGGTIHWGETLETIQVGPTGIEIKTHKDTYQSQFIIGADGRQSKVGKLLGLKTIPHQSERMAIHVYLSPKRKLPRYGFMHILRDGSYIGINPINEDEVNFSMVTDVKQYQILNSPKDLLNFWITKSPELHKYFSTIDTEEIKITFPLTRVTSNLCHPKGVLIGDASGFIDPLTGEGITTAIKSAVLLVDHIKENPDQIGLAFQKYQTHRLVDFRQKETLNRFFQRLIKNPYLCEAIAIFLNLSQEIRNIFIGIIGNIYSPLVGFKKMFSHLLWRRPL